MCTQLAGGLKLNLLHLHILVHEERGTLAKFGSVFRGEIADGAASGAALRHVGVALQIVLEAGGDVFALRHDAHASWHILHDFVHEQRIVCATQYECVD